MTATASPPGELEPIETAFDRRAAGAAAGAAALVAAARLPERALLPEDVRRRRDPPRRRQGPRRPRPVPVHDQGVAARQLPVRHVRGAPRAGLPGPRLLRHHRPPHRRRLHRRRHRHLGDRDGPLDPRGRRPARPHRARRLRVRAVHRRARRALRGRAARLHGRPGLRRDDRAAGDADPRLRAGRHHGHPVVHARDPRRDAAPGPRPGPQLAEVRHLRRRAVDERDALRDGGPRGHRRDRHLRPVGGDGPRRRPGVRRGQGRPARLGGPLLPGGHRPGHRPGRCPTGSSASWSSPR